MKKGWITIILLGMGLGMFAEKITIPVWPDGAPNDNGIVKEDTFANGKFANTCIAELTVYTAPANRANGMAVIACPGGGYLHLAMMHEGHDFADWFNRQGITYAVLKYRMPNGHKDVPLSDAQKALQIVRDHASEWGVNPEKVGIMGSSAGGHLASTAATHLKGKDAPNFQILFYPVITMDKNSTHGGSRNRLIGENPTEEDIALYSNELQVSDSTCPAIILLSSDDRAVQPIGNGIAYYKSLLRHKIPATLLCYPNGGHGWGFRDSFTYKFQWSGELEKWLSEIFR